MPKHATEDKPTKANREAVPPISQYQCLNLSVFFDVQFTGKFYTFIILHLSSSKDFLQNPVQKGRGALRIPVLPTLRARNAGYSLSEVLRVNRLLRHHLVAE